MELAADAAVSAGYGSAGERCMAISVLVTVGNAADRLLPLIRDRIERLVVGDTDPAIRSFLVDRYGDFVRLDPPLKASTMLLWFGPALVLALGLAGITVFIRRRQAETPDTLDASDRARLKRVLAEDDKR